MTTKKRQLYLNPLVAWFVNHFRACVSGFGELIRAPVASLTTMAVIGVAISLPVGLYLLLQNFQTVSRSWSAMPSISLYLQRDVNPEQVERALVKLKIRHDVKSVQYISPQQGLAALNQAIPLNETAALLKNNPLPGVIVVTANRHYQSPDEVKQLQTNLQALPIVDFAQLDMLWVHRLYDLVTIGHRIIYTLALLFSIGVILIVGNTIRLTTQSHQQEIAVLKLVGATHAFIRRPLLYRGLMYGLFGGCVAWLLVTLLLQWLMHPVTDLAQTYRAIFNLHGLSLITSSAILSASALLGLVGSWLATRRYFTSAEHL